ncbi:SusC/RagA family TonB-linked outer membrane protein [Chitinophaga tropicalis]|uniref:SusC/RagA family TonB-linked outer membrane protein n=1 Tax=Chitinophaga tropicalis TaxID=2683588 RepID=A0A7K1U561_9BACT|nr:TonB-dependent receptor [Chitinophaga tropicalis]MVT09480.1 SusC/RagA family TonB-linked outer membrane protein [Chitinophaga tropicalis]
MKKLLTLLMAFLVIGTYVSGQNPPVNVTGKITGREGSPLPGVSVRVKGTPAGTSTNNEGSFTLSGVQENAVLVISSIGFDVMEVKVRRENPHLDITLNSSVKDLGESVVIAYGTVKKRDLTGAVVSIREADITATPVNNVMEALQGKVAGMDIMRPSGAVGSNVDVLLRGTRSIYGDNSPLFIVDGIQSSYSQINPSDIATIDILKDASSTAIYGSAGSNGVVIITTKKGKTNKSNISFDAFYGLSGSPHFFHSMTGNEYVKYRRELYRTVNGEYPQDMSQIFTTESVLDAYNQNKWIDWVGLITNNTATQQKYNLSLSDGSAKTKIYTSFTYTQEDGLLSNENLKRYGVRMNLDHDATTWLKMGTNINVNYTIQNARAKNIFTKSLSALPLGDAYDANGNINVEYVTGETTPLGDQLPNQFADNTRTTFANLNAYVELKPLKDLSFRSVIGTTLNNYRNGKYWGKQAVSNVVSGYASPLAAIYNGFSYGYIWENILTCNKTIAKDHNFTVTGITSWAKNSADYNNALGQGQKLDYYQFYNIGNGTDKTGNASSYEQRQRMSFAGRVNYSFKGKYLLSFTNRWDGVSHLAKGHKWSAFPAAAAAWRISDEPFMTDAAGWLNELKLRAGYGVTGNSGGMSAYSSQTQAYTYQVISLDGKLVPNVQNYGTYSNPNISWERSYNLNIGVDLSLMKGRIDLALDLYNTDTKGLLFKRTLPVTAGLTAWGSPLATWQNIGQTNNKGLEVTLRTRNIVTPAFEWSSSFSFTKNKEKIVSLPDGDIIAEKLFKGQPISTHYDYKYQGIWSTAEEATAALYGAKPGFLKVATKEKFDASGVGDKGVHPYSAEDRMILGSSVPKWLLGINNNFTYRNFDLNIFTMIRWGQMINSGLLGWYTTTDDGQPAGIDYWTPENQSAHFPRPGINGTTGIESLKYVDGSFIKIKTITAGYTLPQRLTRFTHMAKGRIYATAYNPLIYTRNKALKGSDPETGGSDTFPLFTTYVFGMNITF